MYIRIISIIIICGCLALFFYIRHLSKQPMKEFLRFEDACAVAVIGGNDSITFFHLRSLMKSHGIICDMGGSVGHAVYVPTDKSSKAINIIKDDLKKRKYFIILDNHTYEVPKSDWRESYPKAKVDELLLSYSRSTDLGALLRSPEFDNQTLAFPYVMRIKSLKREYMDSQQKILTGHQFEIELAVKPDERIGGAKLWYQVYDWDSKKNIESGGSNEWWTGTSDRNKYDRRKKKDGAGVQGLQTPQPGRCRTLPMPHKYFD